ncbi:MAG: DUF4296 domain-containing protein [Alistipes sp.]|nr:DUF4296 domain-containing protein [Alistipes sp.]
MKRFLRCLLCIGLGALAVACARHKIIPDSKLALIFHDAFLANAYVGNRNMTRDSLNLYEPIFARYGYTTEDVHYTIGNFSKRKSARLGDVVERAIAMLEAEGKFYNHEVAVLDTIDNVAVRSSRRVVYADSLIRVRSLADTAKASFVFDVVPGDYDVRLTYRIDSLDRNTKGIRSSMWLERADGSQTSLSASVLRRQREERLVRHFKVDSSHRRLHVDLIGFVDRPQRPRVTVRDFEVVHTLPKREAVERLYEQQLDIRIFADGFFGGLADDREERPGSEAENRTPATDGSKADPAYPAAESGSPKFPSASPASR